MAIDETPLAELRERTSAKWRTYSPDVIPAWVAEMDFTLADPIAQTLLDAVRRSDTGYRWADEVPSALVEFAKRRWSWEIDPDRVMVLADVMSSIAQALSHLTSPGSSVVINPPVYPPFFSTVEKVVGRGLRQVPLRASEASDGVRYRLDLLALEEAFADPQVEAFLLCSPHNPTGTVHTQSELRQVAELAASHDVLVVSDEIHAPLTLDGAEFVPFMVASEGVPGLRAVACVSASKAWNIPGLKCAQLVAGANSIDVLRDRIPIEATFGVGHFGVLGTVAAYRDSVEWLDEALTVLDARRHMLRDGLGGLPGVNMVWPQASYLAWVRFDGIGDDPAVRVLEEGRVAINSGAAFGDLGAKHARINYATTEAILADVMAAVGATVEARAS